MQPPRPPSGYCRVCATWRPDYGLQKAVSQAFQFHPKIFFCGLAMPVFLLLYKGRVEIMNIYPATIYGQLRPPVKRVIFPRKPSTITPVKWSPNGQAGAPLKIPRGGSDGAPAESKNLGLHRLLSPREDSRLRWAAQPHLNILTDHRAFTR